VEISTIYKKHQIPLPASAHELANLADIPIEVAEATSVSEASTALHQACDRLKDCQKEDVNLWAKWLEGVARVKASHEGSQDTAKTLQTMIQ